MKSDQSTCVADCAVQNPGNYLNLAAEACVPDCFADNSSSVLNQAQTHCVTSCNADEYKDNLVNHNCVKCSQAGGDFTYCTTCDDATHCNTCSRGKCYFHQFYFAYYNLIK